MNRSSFALFVALLIHLVFVLLFTFLGSISPDIEKKVKPKEKRIKVLLREMPETKKKQGLEKKPVKEDKIAPPMPKGKQLKKIIKKPLIKLDPKKIKEKPKVKKPKLNKPKPKPKLKPIEKTKPVPPKKPYIPVKKTKPKHEVYNPFTSVKKDENKTKEVKKTKYSWMKEDKSKDEKVDQKTRKIRGSSISKDIREAYGDEFGKLSVGQQKYILDNQEIMRRITQEVLTRVARVNLPRDISVNKRNVIEFYLHPNGDMTDFKFVKKSGYYVLDDTTKETIEYAYSRYPRPTEKTLIRYNVYYNLARH